jgi:hypothetical protein
MNRKTAPSLLLVALSALALLPVRSAPADPVVPGATDPFVLIQGTWDWANRPGSCQDNPQTLTLSADRTEVKLEFKKPVTNAAGKPQKAEVYKILDARARLLRGQVVGETRKDAAGKVLTYDFLFASNDSFCWHRSDWPKGQCTKMMVRCTGATKH